MEMTLPHLLRSGTQLFRLVLQPGSVSQARLGQLTLPNIGVKSCECVTGVCERATEPPPPTPECVSAVRAQPDPLTELGASCNFHS